LIFPPKRKRVAGEIVLVCTKCLIRIGIKNNITLIISILNFKNL